jgi:hypothetical protein
VKRVAIAGQLGEEFDVTLADRPGPDGGLSYLSRGDRRILLGGLAHALTQ